MGIATLVTAPTVEPVTVADARDACRLMGDTSFDGKLAKLITSARTRCEGRMRRAILPQTWRYRSSCFPGLDVTNLDDLSRRMLARGIFLPYPNLIAVTSFKYIDADGTQQTFTGSDYTVDGDSEPAVLYPVSAASFAWPKTSPAPNAVEIVYSCGYADVAHVPASICEWILAVLVHRFEHPEAAEATPGLTTSIETSGIAELIDPYIVHHVGSA